MAVGTPTIRITTTVISTLIKDLTLYLFTYLGGRGAEMAMWGIEANSRSGIVTPKVRVRCSSTPSMTIRRALMVMRGPRPDPGPRTENQTKAAK